MKRGVEWLSVAGRELARMERADASRIHRAVESFALTGHGDVKALKGEFKGQYRLRVGKWRVFFELESPDRLVITNVDNRGQAY